VQFSQQNTQVLFVENFSGENMNSVVKTKTETHVFSGMTILQIHNMQIRTTFYMTKSS
jgi:hypothetical protein